MTSDQPDIRDVPASGPEPSAWGRAELVVVNRFRISEIDQASFRSTLDAAVAVLRAKAGLESLRVLHNLDESDLWALVTIWQDVGSYRRALSGMESKMVIWPLFALAVNEPSAYLSPEELGDNRPRRQL